MVCSSLQYEIENITKNITTYVSETCLKSSRCHSEEVASIIIIAYVVIFVVGVIGNVCVCAVICSNEYMHTQTNFYLASLAVSDLLLLITGLPLDLTMLRFHTYHLCCYSGEMVGFAISDDNETIRGTDFCEWDNSNKGLQYHCTCVGFVIFYLIPLILVAGMYSDIAKRIASPDLIKNEHCKNEQTKASRNVFKMLVSITVCFFVFWLPFHMQRLLSLILKYHGGEENPSIKTVHYIFHSISGCCFYLNCAANPFLFNVFSNSFRKASVFTGKRLAKKIQSVW
ncbi:unnamed protein product [Cylicocyclus nassatus]|uniref:G-protein coupled receptors family 1 profile domain-containing protein n=1 Tax=Cylicocyclus nassatus TaxID=53992 RepID=A0AA36HCH3_CYLNA|nr:unnamed protein product [Cylicocyclus nassatus]